MANSSNGKFGRGLTGFIIGGLFGMLLAAILPGLDILVLGGGGVDPSTFASMILLGILIFGSLGMAYAVRLSQEKYRVSTLHFQWGAFGFFIGAAASTIVLRLLLFAGTNPSLIIFLYPWITLLLGFLGSLFFMKRIKHQSR